MSVAVIMPNYNNAPYLRQCLDSFADDPAVSEIVIYDNASTDDSVAVIEAHPSAKIRLIKGARNLYATSGRHEAIKASSMPYLAFVDGDDFVSDGMHSACLAALVDHQLDAAVPDIIRVDGDGLNPYLFVPAPSEVIDGETGLMMTINGWRLALWGVLRREIYDAAWNGFEPYGYRDDEHLTRRMILACGRIGGATGSQFYRTMPRPDPPMRLQTGAIRTQIRAVALAASRQRPDWQKQLRLTRNETVWAMIRLLRAFPGAETRSMVPRMLDDLATIELPWKPRDWPHRMTALGLSLLYRR